MILFLRFYFRQLGIRYYLCSLLRVSKTCRVSLVWAWWLHSLKPGLIPDLTLVASAEMHGEKQVNICSCCPASQFLNPPCQHVMQWVLGLAPLWAHHMWGFLETGGICEPQTLLGGCRGLVHLLHGVHLRGVRGAGCQLPADRSKQHKKGLVSEVRMEFPDVTP